jgi:hypothetical protein
MRERAREETERVKCGNVWRSSGNDVWRKIKWKTMKKKKQTENKNKEQRERQKEREREKINTENSSCYNGI